MQGLLTAVPLEEGHRKLESRWKKAYKAGQQSRYLEVTGHGMDDSGGRDSRVQVCLVMGVPAVVGRPFRVFARSSDRLQHCPDGLT